MKRFTARQIAYQAAIAAMYFVLTMITMPLSYGPLQIRLSEALAMLPFIMPESIVGITVGCFLANLLSPVFPLMDAVFGALATLCAGICTSFIRNRWLAGIPPVLINGLAVPLMWYLLGGEGAFLVNAGSVILSEAASVYVLGIPLTAALERNAPFLATRKGRGPRSGEDGDLPR